MKGLAPFGEPEGAAAHIHHRNPAAPHDQIPGPAGGGNGRGQGDPYPQPRSRRLEDRQTRMSNTTSPVIRNFPLQAEDPLSASQDFVLTTTMGRPGWRIRVEARSRQSVTASDFVLKAEMKAFLNDKEEFAKVWDYTIPRDNL